MVSESGPAGCVRRAGALQLSITVDFPLSFELACEFYMAAISAGAGRNAVLTVSDLERDEGRAARTLAVVVDADQTTNPGVFRVTVPADLYPGEMPDADLDTGVPCAICYLRKTQGSEVRTVRFLLVFRRGLPA